MAVWGKKRNRYVDLSEKMRKDQERIENLKSDMEESSGQNVSLDKSPSETSSSGGGFFSFFGGSNTSDSTSSSSSESVDGPEEKRKRLSKRLSDMTSKMEDLENQIYHLKQKVELLEKKQKIGY